MSRRRLIEGAVVAVVTLPVAILLDEPWLWPVMIAAAFYLLDQWRTA